LEWHVLTNEQSRLYVNSSIDNGRSPHDPRTLFSPEHEDFRKTVRRFIAEGNHAASWRWEEQQHVDRAIWNRAGELGFLCNTMRSSTAAPAPTGSTASS